MVEMTHSSAVSSLGSEFDEFLFAPVGEERNGMLLSVLSALARLDIDPWQEAANLADLPGETATERLTSLIAALPDGTSEHRDARTIAARLVALLPIRPNSNTPPHKRSLSAITLTEFVPVICLISYVIFTTFVMHIHVGTENHQPPAQVDNAHAPASNIVSPQVPLADAGK